MKIITSDQILNDKNFTYDRSELSLTLSERKVIEETCVGVSYLFSNKSEFSFKSFVRYFLEVHIDRPGKGGIQLVFANRFIEKKSKIRSYQKLFYKEHELIGKGHFKEAEIELSDDRSLFLGMVGVTKSNLDYCVNRLFTSLFTFGFHTEDSYGNLYDDRFLIKIKDEFLELTEMRYFNPLKAYLGLREKSQMSFRITLHGNNDQSLDLLTSKAKANHYLGLGKDYREQEKGVIYN